MWQYPCVANGGAHHGVTDMIYGMLSAYCAYENANASDCSYSHDGMTVTCNGGGGATYTVGFVARERTDWCVIEFDDHEEHGRMRLTGLFSNNQLMSLFLEHGDVGECLCIVGCMD